MAVLDRGIPHRYYSDSDLDFVNRIAEAIVAQIGALDRDSKDRIMLGLSARLCEMVAYENAGKWTSAMVADLVLISAQIERKSVPNSRLD